MSELIKKGFENIRFWQDKNGNEVDLIVEQGVDLIPIEVKFKQNLKSEDFKGIDYFLKSYPLTRKSYIVNLSSQKVSSKTNFILPYSLVKL